MAKKKTVKKKAGGAGREASPSALSSTYLELLDDLKQRIRGARIRAHLATNAELIKLYWDIGKTIADRQKSDGWGKDVVGRLSSDLSSEFPNIKGLSLSSLWRMRSFHLSYIQDIRNLQRGGEEKLARAVRDSWEGVDSSEAVPLAVAMRAFGGDPKNVIEELNRYLVA